MIALYPYAYYLHLHGKQVKIKTNKGMKHFYFFADEITYHEKQRNWFYEDNTSAVTMMFMDDIPNVLIHKPTLDLEQFAVPHLKSIYANDKFKKDSVYICNRYNNEWIINKELNRPINFFDLEVLHNIFMTYHDRQIYYFNIYGNKDFEDGTEALNLNDYEFCQQYENVKHIADICDIKDGDAYNLNQLKILANCSTAITMNGGGSILASYFPLKNIIYYKPVKLSNGSYAPKEHMTNDFNYYHLFGGAEIIVVNSYDEILNNM
jgi:hypothetical protein